MTKLIVGVIMTLMPLALAGQTFQIESAGEFQSEINIPTGTVVDEPGYHRFISADGTVEFKMPRTDLISPSIAASLTDDVYTYIITNNTTAAQPIAIIKVTEKPILVEVETDPRFTFVGDGWLSADGRIPAGQSATFKFKAPGTKPGRIKVRFMNVPAELITLPPNIPHGLEVRMTNHLKNHDHVEVEAIGPQ